MRNSDPSPAGNPALWLSLLAVALLIGAALRLLTGNDAQPDPPHRDAAAPVPFVLVFAPLA